MNTTTLTAFRAIAADMIGEADWQWVGPHLSQRMFGITRERAEAYAQRHGGVAQEMARVCGACGDVKPVGQSCGCFDNGGE